MNSVIKSVVYRATEVGREVVGIRRGWEGLTLMDPSLDIDPAYIRPLDRDTTRAIDRTGGTVLHTSRTNPARTARSRLPANVPRDELSRYQSDGGVYDLTPVVLRNLERLGISTLVAIGGDLPAASAHTLLGQAYRGNPKLLSLTESTPRGNAARGRFHADRCGIRVRKNVDEELKPRPQPDF